MSKISGPLVDRIDIHIEVPSVAYHDLSGGTPGTPSAELRTQVATARAAQALKSRATMIAIFIRSATDALAYTQKLFGLHQEIWQTCVMHDK